MNISYEGSFDEIENKNILSHWQDNIELIRVMAGKVNCLINGRVYVLRAGDICAVNQKQVHRIYNGDIKETEFQTVIIDPKVLTADREICDKYIEPLLNNDEFSHIIGQQGRTFTKHIVQLMDRIVDLENRKPLAYELEKIAFIHMIFFELYTAYMSRKKSVIGYDSDMLIYRKMADYIYENYVDKISLKDIADSGNVSRNKCCSIFKKFTQYSPINFLNNYRLEESLKMLQSDEDIGSIAYNCGFGQQSYYNRLFLRHYGCTPKEYRRRVQKGES